MFKFVESKTFFYISAMLSLIWAASGYPYMKENIAVGGNMAFIIILIVAMMVFYNYKNKEMMKALLSAFITIVFITTVYSSGDVLRSYYIRIVQQTSHGYHNDQIRMFITTANVFVIPILLLLLFINHFIINFNGEASKVMINFNKAIVILLLIFVITDKISVYIVNKLTGSQLFTLPLEISVLTIIRNLPVVFNVFMIVSAEAFINTQRELKTKKK